MPATIPLQPQLYLKLGGADAPTEMLTDLRRVEVDLSLYLPDMFTIELSDQRLEWVGDARLAIGQEIQIGTRSAEGELDQATALLVGEVTAVEATYHESGVPTVVVHGYDRAHLLHRGTKVKSFLQMTDSDIATKIAQDRGLQADVDSTRHVHTQLIQDNMTDFEFLTGRAKAVGFVFAVEKKKLIFKKPANAAREVIDLDYGKTLHEFRTRMTVAAQVKEVSVRGWDQVDKRAIIGNASSTDFQTAKTGWAKRGSAVAAQLFGADAGSVQVSDFPITSQAEGDALAGSVLAGRWSNDFLAEGEAVGNPKLRAGSMAKIDGVAPKFNGEYYVTRARHIFEAGGEYRTAFNIGGFGPDSTADLILENSTEIQRRAQGVSRGLVLALVSNSKDPDNRGRVKLKYPWLAEEMESDWAHVAAPMAGKDRGFFFLPEVNDLVLVGFEHGDFNRAYVLGALWNGKDTPPLNDAVGGPGTVDKRIIKTRAGHILEFDDVSGSEKISIIDHTNKNKIVIDSASNKITVEASGPGGEIDVTAQNKVSVKALNVSVEGTAKLELKGAQVEISGTAMVKIQGAIVQIN